MMPDNPVFTSDEGNELPKNVERHTAVAALSPQIPPGSYKDMDIELQNLSLNRNQNMRPNVIVSSSSVCIKEEGILDEDPWTAPEFTETGPSWSGLSATGKFVRVVQGLAKLIGVLVLLYLFVISLDLLSSAFRLIGGRAAGRTFQESELLSNPVVGLMIGVLVTVIVQSSSTSSSIVIAMVSSGMLDVARAVFIIMGANVGTTITNTLVSLTQSGNRNQFRRAFAGATIHDMFNWLTVIILLPLEVMTGYLTALTRAILSGWDPVRNEAGNIELLTAITKPLTRIVIQLNSKVIEDIAKGDPTVANRSLIRENCSTKTDPNRTCQYLFHDTGMTETNTGVALLFLSLLVLCLSLVGIVKILNSIMKGAMAGALRRSLNMNFPGRMSFLTGYAAMAVGAAVTFLIQSSSVFTSALTPLIGLGVVSLERVYPLTLGSNIGTTGTGLLAAMASSPQSLKPAVQVALSHLFFNITGILIWYPIPFMRQVPISLAKSLGDITARYRWFAFVYIVLVFLLIPAAIVGLTLAGPDVFMGVGITVLILLATLMIINMLQSRYPKALPAFLRDWNFLPAWMRSLEPYDNLLHQINVFHLCRCCNSTSKDEVPIRDVSQETVM
ncbi:hypothetical protein RvY_01301 [Ramazzottius varieornatus]|uniref:Sodium-dependent phosphate transport protein 2B n=1 Tax=Ramazzottius varieornatus TaxID=947166 RepID=A0A1D1ULX2_RAMVA|nr:hypothetical protein RvY_01301 [Ramazzottius varieornatus]